MAPETVRLKVTGCQEHLEVAGNTGRRHPLGWLAATVLVHLPGGRGEHLQMQATIRLLKTLGYLGSRFPGKDDDARADRGAASAIDVSPWDRLSNESAFAYACFQVYRDREKASRNVRRISEMTAVPASTLYRWSAKHQWRGRTRQFDDWPKQRVEGPGRLPPAFHRWERDLEELRRVLLFDYFVERDGHRRLDDGRSERFRIEMENQVEVVRNVGTSTYPPALVYWSAARAYEAGTLTVCLGCWAIHADWPKWPSKSRGRLCETCRERVGEVWRRVRDRLGHRNLPREQYESILERARRDLPRLASGELTAEDFEAKHAPRRPRGGNRRALH